MSIVTCDVVEASASASSSAFAEIDVVVSNGSVARSFLVWAIASMLVDSSATATDYAELQPAAQITEYIVASDSAITQANLTTIVVDSIVASDALLYTPEQLVIESAVATSAVEYSRDSFLTDQATASDTAMISAGITALIIEHATASDELFGYNDLVLVDTATASSSVFMSNESTALLVSSAVASDSVVVDNDLANVLTDHAVATSVVWAQLVATTTITDHAVAYDRALFTLTALGWVMNTESFGMSRYTALPFESMAVVNGRVLALGAEGLYELTGDTDEGAPIEAAVTTGRSMLGSNMSKRVAEVHLTGTASDEMELAVSVYGQHKGTYSYTMAKREADAPRGHRVKLGKGLASVYWKFSITNKNGGDFVIDAINADVAPSTNRRI